jgi:Flp pilus assembly protein CpaB
MFGVLDASAFGFKKKVSLVGMIAVPTVPATVPAYTKLTRDNLWDLKNHTLSVIYLSKQQITPEMMTNLNKILGRVLNHDKLPGYVFTEADFLPDGTRPGLVAGIPTGKRAMRVDATKVQGLVGLLPGDRFDLVATIPIDIARASQGLQAAGGVYSQQLALQNQLTNWQKQATVRVLVQNGAIVEPMTNRKIPVSSNTLTQGLITREKTVQEIVVAVGPDEVAKLTEALAVNAEINCVPRSGRPDDPQNSVTPDLQPWSPFQGLVAATPPLDPSVQAESAVASPGAVSSSLTTIESISGSKRNMVATPRQH